MSKLVTPAHDTDYKYGYEQNELAKLHCIHCGKKFSYHTYITYTRLSSGKLIFWHTKGLAYNQYRPCQKP